MTAYLRFLRLTGAKDGNPAVELVVVGHGVKLTAQHLPEGGFISLTRFCVAGPIALPLPCAVSAPELWPAKCSGRL